MNFEPDVLGKWKANAAAWTQWMQASGTSRSISGPALLDLIHRLLGDGPAQVLDIGCGEGWLGRALRPVPGLRVDGIDGVDALVQAARIGSSGSYAVRSYETLDLESLSRDGIEVPAAGYDLVVCNFSLLDQHDTVALLRRAPALLRRGGHLIVQTLHPHSCAPPYQDGWRIESWESFSPPMPQPSPWYFRRLESWFRDLRLAGLQVVELLEPGDRHSLILVAMSTALCPSRDSTF